MEYNMIFVLGYDLLQDRLAKYNIPCDIAFDICKEIYGDFVNCDEYRLDMPEYNALQIYIGNNKELIDGLIEPHKDFWD